jgi:hypothetical protein
MKIIIREARPGDAHAFLDVHRAAVRQIAAKDYPQAVIDDWAPLPVTDDAIISFLATRIMSSVLSRKVRVRLLGSAHWS